MADLPHLCVHPLIILSLLYCIGIGTISLLDAISTVTMTSSYSSALSEFFNLHTTAKDWTCQEINISVATSLDDDTPRDINLADTLGYRKNVPSSNKRSDRNCYWLLKIFNKNNTTFRQREIHPVIVCACHAAGFIVHGEYESEYNCIQFECRDSKYHDEEKRKAWRDAQPRRVKDDSIPLVPRKRKPARPIAIKKEKIEDKEDAVDANEDAADEDDEERGACTFRFRLYWDEDKERWFFPHKQRGCADHCGHLHVAPQFLRMQTRFEDANELEVAEDALESHITATATGSLFTRRTGRHLDIHQLKYLKSRNKNDLVMNARDSLGDSLQGVTAVDRLIADLESDPKTSFVVLYAEFASNLLTLKTKTKHLDNAALVAEFSEDNLDGVDTDSPSQYAKDMKIRSALTNSANGQLLLAIAWSNEEARRKFDMFPEFMGGDDTEDTNSEKRPLYTLCGKDNMNQVFGHTWAFMPSKSTWVYSWIFSNALPLLHPGTALNRVEQFIMDACPHETRAAEGVCGYGRKQLQTNESIAALAVCGGGIKVSRTLPNAHLRHCGWHKINRNLTEDSNYKSKFTAARKSSVNASIEVDAFVKWLWYFIKYYESQEEVDLSMELLGHYLNEDQKDHYGALPEDLRSELRDFITKKYQYNSTKLFEASFLGLMTMGNCTSSVNESEHHAYKTHSQGPRPQHDVAESAKRIKNINQAKEIRKSKKIAADIQSTHGKAKDREERDSRLTEYCNDHLLKEYNEAAKYCCHRATDDTFYVKRMYYEHDKTPDEDLELSQTICDMLLKQMNGELAQVFSTQGKKKLNKHWDSKFSSGPKGLEEYKVLLNRVVRHIIPRFERTRSVKIISQGNDRIITCDCNRWVKWGMACRHIYAILKRHPKANDAKVRWLIGYSYYYGRNDAMSKHLIKMRDECNIIGVPISDVEMQYIDDHFSVGEQSVVPLDYFTRSLKGKLRLISPNYWQEHADQLCSSLKINSECLGCLPCDAKGRDMKSLGSVPTAKKAKTNGPTAPIGATQEVHCKQGYKVPSQEDDLMIMSDKSTKTDPYHRYMSMYEACAGNKSSQLNEDFAPMYASCIKLTESLGKEGGDIMRTGLSDMHSQIQEVMSTGLSNIRAKLAEQHANKDGRLSGGMESIPTLVHSVRKPKRKTTASSPNSNVKRQRR